MSPLCGVFISMILVFSTGRRMPKVYLLTRMKSPTKRVGFIEPEGMRKGSTKNDRNTSTINMTGNNDTHSSIKAGGVGGSFFLLSVVFSGVRLGDSQKCSAAVTSPVIAVSITNQNATSKFIYSRLG